MENNQVNQNVEIRLLDLYFEKINFKQLKAGKPGEIKLQVNNKFEFAKSADHKNLKTTIITTIHDDDMRLNIELYTVGVFLLNDDTDYDNPKYTEIMVNTMWPFTRNEIQLITTQPGITPIILPLLSPYRASKEKTIFA
ncbi:MAG: protein-export chaperone SecB [Gammaproteobacteria bacterium]|nr:protein-export chaperone SecB [Gammaproteobacteria bacterium]